MHPATRWLAIDLTSNAKNVILTSKTSTRHGSEEKRIRNGCIKTHLSNQISDSSGSIEFADLTKPGPMSLNSSNSLGDEETRISLEVSLGAKTMMKPDFTKSPKVSAFWSHNVNLNQTKELSDLSGSDSEPDLCETPKRRGTEVYRPVQTIPNSIQSHSMPQSPKTPNMVKPSFPRKWNHQGNKFSQKPKTLKFIDTTKIISPNHIDYWLPSSFEEILQEEDSSDNEFDEKKASLDDSVKGYNPETHYADPYVRYKKLQKFMRNEQKSCRNSQSENPCKRKSECINKNLKNSITMKNKFSGRNQNICSTKDLSLNKAKFLDSRNSRNSVSHHDRTVSYSSSIDSENGIREVSLEGNLESPSHFMVNNTRVIRPQTKKKHEREVIGFIDHKYQFVLPNCDLQPKEESILSLEKLNIFKLLEKEPPNEEVSRRIALDIIKEITRAEARKYRHHPLMYKFVSKILDQDTSYRD